MKPCCLSAWRVDSEAECKGQARIGGASGFTAGACPSTADEAYALSRQELEVAANSASSDQQFDATVKQALPAEPDPKGCCFAYGHGAMMQPCCLKTWRAKANDCSAQDRLGGVVGFTSGPCPQTAEQAVALQRLELMEPGPVSITAPPALAEGPQNQQATSAALVTEVSGCCFGIGYGAQMVPCCLETQPVSDVRHCTSSSLVGGARSFKVGACPASADEAARLRRDTKDAKLHLATETSGHLLMGLAMVVVALATGAFFLWRRPQRDARLTGPLLQGAE